MLRHAGFGGAPVPADCKVRHLPLIVEIHKDGLISKPQFFSFLEIDHMARITVEDCLNHESNRFSLVRLAAQRAKQLLEGSSPVTDTKGNRAIVSALREIASGKVRFEKAADSELDAPLAAQPPSLTADTAAKSSGESALL